MPAQGVPYVDIGGWPPSRQAEGLWPQWTHAVHRANRRGMRGFQGGDRRHRRELCCKSDLWEGAMMGR